MKKIVILVILMSFIFSGCWDTRELNELGLVMAVGVDKAKEGEGYEISVQVAKPKEGSSGQGGAGETVWIGTAKGDTLFDAIRNVAKFSSRRIMWAHNNVIIIGEGLAEEGITPVIDFFSHNVELRMKTWVAISRGAAREYVATKTGIEDIPAISIARLYLYNELPAKSVRSDMLKLFRDYKSDTIEPVISTLNKLPRGTDGSTTPQIELSGAAVFKYDKLVGWLSPEEARGIAWLRGEAKNAIISVTYGSTEKEKVAVELRNIKIKKESYIKDGKPSFKFTLKATGSINEQDASTNISMEDLKSQVEVLASKKIEDQIKNSMEKLQKDFNSDVIGLGRILHVQHKNEWNSGLKEKWAELYSESNIEVNADVNINMSSLFQIPIKNEKIKGESNESKD
jgi:spore germination protein KC